jgi:hypothetical protein
VNVLQHRAAQAMEKLANARSPVEKHEARQEALAIKLDLENFLAAENFKAAFKAAQPKSVVGMYKGQPRFFFMVRADGSKPVAAVALPDETMVKPIQGQIPVPETMVAAMVARGWKRANDVITPANIGMRDPARPNA